MLRRAALALLLAASVAAPALAAPSCPAPLADATRLLLVLTDGMSSTRASVRLFQRDGTAWRPDGAARAATVGRGGLGWAFDQADRAGKGEPVKREGDGRTPAGVFSAGHAFGTDPHGLSDYFTLSEGTSCVDDLASEFYNSIVPATKLSPGISREKMWRIPLYRQGVLVENATSRERRGGSCIFVHVWRAPGRPTVGCVASDERTVRRIQQSFDERDAAVAILPAAALSRYAGCGLPED